MNAGSGKTVNAVLRLVLLVAFALVLVGAGVARSRVALYDDKRCDAPNRVSSLSEDTLVDLVLTLVGTVALRNSTESTCGQCSYGVLRGEQKRRNTFSFFFLSQSF